MFTGGLLGLINRGHRFASFNDDDSDPAGLGQDIVAFILSLKDDEQIATMNRRVEELTWIDDNNKDTHALTFELQKRYARFRDLNVGGSAWCRLLSKAQGAAALSAILSGELKHCHTGGDMLGEWAYFVDFEKKTLQTWKLAWNGDAMLEEASFGKLAEEGREYMARMEEEGKGYMSRMQELWDAKNADESKDEDEWDDEEEQVVGEWDDDLCCDEGFWAIRGAE